MCIRDSGITGDRIKISAVGVYLNLCGLKINGKEAVHDPAMKPKTISFGFIKSSPEGNRSKNTFPLKPDLVNRFKSGSLKTITK